jgi:hypothetical protein
MGHMSKRSARWDALFGGGSQDDYKQVERTIADMRSMTGCGSLIKFEAQAFELVKRTWPAIDALGRVLLERHVLEYEDAAVTVVPLLA